MKKTEAIKIMGIRGTCEYTYRHICIIGIKSWIIKKYLQILGARIGKKTAFIKKPTVSIHHHNIEIGSNCIIEASCILPTKEGRVKIGNSVTIYRGAIIMSGNSVEICNNVFISPDFFVTDTNHKTAHAPTVTSEPVRIGNNSWIAYRCIMTPGSEIGNNCIVGAGSVVTKKFGDNLLIAGNPAEIKKELKHNGNRI